MELPGFVLGVEAQGSLMDAIFECGNLDLFHHLMKRPWFTPWHREEVFDMFGATKAQWKRLAVRMLRHHRNADLRVLSRIFTKMRAAPTEPLYKCDRRIAYDRFWNNGP